MLSCITSEVHNFLPQLFLGSPWKDSKAVQVPVGCCSWTRGNYIESKWRDVSLPCFERIARYSFWLVAVSLERYFIEWFGNIRADILKFKRSLRLSDCILHVLVRWAYIWAGATFWFCMRQIFVLQWTPHSLGLSWRLLHSKSQSFPTTQRYACTNSVLKLMLSLVSTLYCRNSRELHILELLSPLDQLGLRICTLPFLAEDSWSPLKTGVPSFLQVVTISRG